jgi:hypothetical protein
MAHDETASTSKWAKDEHPVGGQQQLKKSPIGEKRIPARLRLSPLDSIAVLRRVPRCASMHRLSQEKQEGNPTKLLTHRSAFIHDVSYPLPTPQAALFGRSTARHHQGLIAHWLPRFHP